jgi:D-glycero-D-manno-heptose 1,7-bisphosphate phosphatase
MNRAVFLDRDGVLNELIYYPDYDEDESPRQPEHLRMIPGAVDALRALSAAGWLLFIVSNQPSYAKGKTTLESLNAVHDALTAQLTAAGVQFTGAYYSHTHPRGVVPGYTTESVYRKPNPGFLLEAGRDYNVVLASSWMVGDRDTDIACGQHAGAQTALVYYPLSRAKQGSTQPDLTCNDLQDFVSLLEGVRG